MSTDIQTILEQFPAGRKDALIPLLQAIQAEGGYLSTEILEQVGRHLAIPANKVYGVATFYDQFRFHPFGKYHFKVCRGTSCHLFGNASMLKEIEKQLRIKAGAVTRDGLFSVEAVTCLGSCDQGPVVLLNEEPHCHMTPEALTQLIDSIKENESSHGS